MQSLFPLGDMCTQRLQRSIATSKCKIIQGSSSCKNLIISDNLLSDICYLINNKVRVFIGQPPSITNIVA